MTKNLALPLLMTLLAIACNDPVTNDESAASTDDVTTNDEGDETTGGADLCAADDPGNNVVSETQVDSPYPAPAGGEIADGTYEMIRFEVYAPATADDHVRRRRIIVDQGTMVSINQDDADPLQVIGGTFTVSGTEFLADIVCPSAGTRSTPFTVSGDEFWIFDPSEPNLQVYTRL